MAFYRLFIMFCSRSVHGTLKRLSWKVSLPLSQLRRQHFVKKIYRIQMMKWSTNQSSSFVSRVAWTHYLNDSSFKLLLFSSDNSAAQAVSWMSKLLCHGHFLLLAVALQAMVSFDIEFYTSTLLYRTSCNKHNACSFFYSTISSNPFCLVGSCTQSTNM